MSAPARKPLGKSAIRAIAIRRSVARRQAANDNQVARKRRMAAGLLAACVEAGGFDQNARFA